MLPATLQVPAAVVLVLAGLLACFAGYRLFRIVLGIYGFVLGALVASSLMGTSEPLPMIVAAIVGGVVGGLILILAYFAGVAIVGAGIGALLVHLLWGLFGREPGAIVVILFAILGALGAMVVQRYVIILSTAFAGAWTALWGGVTIAGGTTAAATVRDGVWLPYPMQPAPGELWFYAAWFVLGIVGALVQVFGTAKARA